MSFANKLKGLMEELDLTQAKVSDLTGIGRSSISQYVSGKNEPSKERRKEIARSLGVQDNYFEEYDPVATVQYNSTVNLPVELVATGRGFPVGLCREAGTLELLHFLC